MNTFNYDNEYWKVQVPGRGRPGLQSRVIGLKENSDTSKENNEKHDKQEHK